MLIKSTLCFSKIVLPGTVSTSCTLNKHYFRGPLADPVVGLWPHAHSGHGGYHCWPHQSLGLLPCPSGGSSPHPSGGRRGQGLPQTRVQETGAPQKVAATVGHRVFHSALSVHQPWVCFSVCPESSAVPPAATMQMVQTQAISLCAHPERSALFLAVGPLVLA